MSTDVQAQATLALPGSLTVTKTIGGAAAGQQGEIRIDVSCNGVGLDPFIIPAGRGTRATPTTACWRPDVHHHGDHRRLDRDRGGDRPRGSGDDQPWLTVAAAVSDEYTVGTTRRRDDHPRHGRGRDSPPTGPGSGTVPGAPIAALLLLAGGGWCCWSSDEPPAEPSRSCPPTVVHVPVTDLGRS